MKKPITRGDRRADNATPKAAADPRDRTIRDLREKVDRLEAKLSVEERQARNLQRNCTTYRIKLEHAQAAIKGQALLMAELTSDAIGQRAYRAQQDADELIPF